MQVMRILKDIERQALDISLDDMGDEVRNLRAFELRIILDKGNVASGPVVRFEYAHGFLVIKNMFQFKQSGDSYEEVFIPFDAIKAVVPIWL